jgi:hypothetical protein
MVGIRVRADACAQAGGPLSNPTLLPSSHYRQVDRTSVEAPAAKTQKADGLLHRRRVRTFVSL